MLEITSFASYHLETLTYENGETKCEPIPFFVYNSVDEAISDLVDIWEGEEVRIVDTQTNEIAAWLHKDGEVYEWNHGCKKFVFTRSIA